MVDRDETNSLVIQDPGAYAQPVVLPEAETFERLLLRLGLYDSQLAVLKDHPEQYFDLDEF
jgi:hypothetical protein